MNVELLTLKEDTLNSILETHSKRKYSIDIIYHGIPLHIKTNSENLITELKETLPKNWFKSSINSYQIDIYSPLEFKIEPEIWCNEESQDCVIKEDGALAIHRDFIAREMNKDVTLICEDRLSDGLYNFLRWFLPKKLYEIDSFVLHSCCIVGKDGKARFFLGHSGAGKSTIASMAQGRKILGDDMNLLQFKENLAYPGAIGGLFIDGVNYNDSFEIEGFYWLNQDSKNEVSAMSKAKAHSKLLASVTNLFWDSLSDEKIQKIMEITYNISSEIPSYELNFTKSSDFWELINA
jgi:hypothetical protein